MRIFKRRELTAEEQLLKLSDARFDAWQNYQATKGNLRIGMRPSELKRRQDKSREKLAEYHAALDTEREFARAHGLKEPM